MRNSKRLLIAAVTIAGLTGGAMVAHADPFRSRAYENPAALHQNLANAPEWPSIPSTCTLVERDTDACSVSLVAGVGQVGLTDGAGVTSVPFWGFGVNGAPVALAGAKGSIIKVPVGTVIHLAFTQGPGTGRAIDLTFPSLANVEPTAVGYDVTADHVGTMVFQPGTHSAASGLDAPRQVAMGMVGVLIVTPVTEGTPEVLDTDGNVVSPAVPPKDCSACAYDATASYADEALVALTTIDKAFAQSNGTGDLSYFGQSHDAQGKNRKVYNLINGKAFPDTDVIDVREGDSLLLRYLNAGLEDRNMGLLGLRQSVLGANTSEYTDPQSMIAPRVGPGETLDVAVNIPTGVAEGQKYSLMDQGRGLNGATAQGFGGALTFVDVWTGPTIDQLTIDPSALAAAPSGTVVVTTTAHPSVGHAITGYQVVATDSATPPVDAFWPTTVAFAGTLDVDALIVTDPVSAAGGQYVWMRAQQDNGGWTAAVSVKVTALPTVKIDSIANSTDRTVTFSAIAFDGANITSVEAGFGDVNAPTGWAATVTDGPTAGTHVVLGTDHHGEEVWVRATDSYGNVSVAQHAPIPLDVPKVVSLSYDGSAQLLTGTFTIDPAAAPATVQWAVTATPDNTTLWTNGVGSTTTISESVTAADGDKIWVRVLDAKGNTSDPLSTTVSIPVVVPAP